MQRIMCTLFKHRDFSARIYTYPYFFFNNLSRVYSSLSRIVEIVLGRGHIVLLRDDTNTIQTDPRK